MSLLRKEKKEYSVKINENNIIDNRKFGQTVKPFLSDKFKSKKPFILVNNDDIIKLRQQKPSMNFSQILSKISKFWNINVRVTRAVDYQVIQSYKQ